MRFLLISILFVLLLSCVVVADEGTTNTSQWLWLGGHYTEFDDGYTKKVGEYNLGENEFLPEFKYKAISTTENSVFTMFGHYYDKNNVFGRLTTAVADKFKAKVQYRSMIKQEGQDLMENMEAREYLPSTDSQSGKMLTHDITDPGADYNTHRQEFLADVSVLLSKKNNLRFNAAHRTILKTGTEQKISSTHCFSCHMESQTGVVDNKQHQFELGLDGEVGKFDVGYKFGYRIFESEGPNAQTYYDDARHPVHGGAGGEFGPRVIYEDEILDFAVLPKTEKMSHKVRFKNSFGKGYWSGAFGYAKAENKGTQLGVKTYNGGLNFATRLNEKTRLVAKATGAKVESDDIFIDLPTYRDGAADGNEYDFDFMRYSSLDRTTAKFSAEVTTRLNPKMTLAVLGGYDMLSRTDYPIYDDGISTKKMYGQLRFKYRNGMKMSTSFKYRFETISDPFVSARGLFESIGHGDPALDPLVPTSSWVFYFQREWLRYQPITIDPTMAHTFEFKTSYRPDSKISANFGIKVNMDKNDDLDSLDVEHFSMIPSFSLNLTPNQKTSFYTGYTYNYDKSRHPVTIALFDG